MSFAHMARKRFLLTAGIIIGGSGPRPFAIFLARLHSQNRRKYSQDMRITCDDLSSLRFLGFTTCPIETIRNDTAAAILNPRNLNTVLRFADSSKVCP